jgi:hypothetical protein
MWLGKVDLSRFGSQFDYELRKNRYNTGGAAGKKLIGVQSLFIYFFRKQSSILHHSLSNKAGVDITDAAWWHTTSSHVPPGGCLFLSFHHSFTSFGEIQKLDDLSFLLLGPSSF